MRCEDVAAEIEYTKWEGGAGVREHVHESTYRTECVCTLEGYQRFVEAAARTARALGVNEARGWSVCFSFRVNIGRTAAESAILIM